MAQHAHLFNGYPRVVSVRTTLTASTVHAIAWPSANTGAAADPDTVLDFEFKTSAVLIFPPSTGSLFVVIDDEVNHDDVTDPDDAGAGDADNEMIELASTDGPLSIDAQARTVKLIHSATPDIRVLLLGEGG